MSDRKHQVQVGVLFIASIVVLVVGILWFKEFKVSEKSYRIVVEFPTTSGLVKGDPVEVKGVPSGKEADIRFEYGKALVTLQLGRNVHLYEGTTVAIENAGLMGQKVVAIYPGTPQGEPIPEGAILKGDYRLGITELMGGLGGALNTFERLATRVDSLLAAFDKSKQDRLDNTLTNVERATDELATLLEENRDDLARGIRGLAEAMDDVHAMVDGRGEQFGETLDDASAAAARLDSTLTKLDGVVTSLDGVLAKVESGEGTLGRLVQNDALYYELVVTLRDAKALMQDVRENPKRYFKFSIF
jgi:phospholipid/cholesterol/gamma-HCH transport system substrate-binding protein